MSDQSEQDEEEVVDQGLGGPVEETTASVKVPRADGEGDEVIRQQPVGHGQALGGGEFPDRNAPSRGPEELEEG